MRRPNSRADPGRRCQYSVNWTRLSPIRRRSPSNRLQAEYLGVDVDLLAQGQPGRRRGVVVEDDQRHVVVGRTVPAMAGDGSPEVPGRSCRDGSRIGRTCAQRPAIPTSPSRLPGGIGGLAQGVGVKHEQIAAAQLDVERLVARLLRRDPVASWPRPRDRRARCESNDQRPGRSPGNKAGADAPRCRRTADLADARYVITRAVANRCISAIVGKLAVEPLDEPLLTLLIDVLAQQRPQRRSKTRRPTSRVPRRRRPRSA